MYVNLIVTSLTGENSFPRRWQRLARRALHTVWWYSWFVYWYWFFTSVNLEEVLTRWQHSSPKGSVLTILTPFEGYKSKLLSRRELPWPLYVISRNYKLRTATGNVRPKKEFTLNCSLEVMDGNDLEISQPDKIYESSWHNPLKYEFVF